jgi:hypothetical protein
LRLDINKGSEVLAHHANSQFAAIMIERHVELCSQRRQLVGPGRFDGLAQQRSADLADQPGSSLRGPADHRRISARGCNGLAGILGRMDIAIDDQRDGDRLFHRPHGGPVGLALVELLAGTAVYRHQLDAGILGPPRQFRRVDAVMIPTQAHFQRHRHAGRSDSRLNQGQRMIEIAHQGGAGQALGHLPGRTPHIDIDDIGPGIDGNAGALRHPVCLAPGQLDHTGLQRCVERRLAHHIDPAAGQRVAGDHFRHDHARPETLRLAAERQVCHTRHGRQNGRNGDPVGTDREVHASGQILKGRRKPVRLAIMLRCGNA